MDGAQPGIAFVFTSVNTTVPQPPIRGSLECFPCDPMKQPLFCWQHNELTIELCTMGAFSHELVNNLQPMCSP